MTRSKWWRNAVVYEVYVRSFADSGGDGEGDLEGIRTRLPYLRDLGVDALWLTPFYRSPLADGGYDVADYRDVDPRFGSLADFDRLVADTHAHGLRMIVDIVPNHTSDQHPWFREAIAAPPGSPARNRYLFLPDTGTGEPPNDWPSAFGGPAWSRTPDGHWYLHLYAPEQPDLNWRNPEVRAEFEDILRFWLDRGVDGFRIDVAAGLFKDADFTDAGDLGRHAIGTPMYSRPEVHDVYRDWRRIIDSYAPEESTEAEKSTEAGVTGVTGSTVERGQTVEGGQGSLPGRRMAVGEVWTDSAEDLALFLRPDELHQAFNFALQLAPWSATAFRTVVDDCLRTMEPSHAAPTWVLSSHDSVRHPTRYADPDRPGLGLRRARAALLFMLALPGSAYIYQGEELGLREVTDLPEEARQDPIWFRTGGASAGRDGCRVPIPWSGTSEPYGFSAPGVRPWLPMPSDWKSQTVQAQTGDPRSTLEFYRQALSTRRELLPSLPDSLRWLDRQEAESVRHQDLVQDGRAASGGRGSAAAPAPWTGAPSSLVYQRGPLVCALNFGDMPVRLPAFDEILIASDPLRGDLLPGSTAVWLVPAEHHIEG